MLSYRYPIFVSPCSPFRRCVHLETTFEPRSLRCSTRLFSFGVTARQSSSRCAISKFTSLPQLQVFWLKILPEFLRLVKIGIWKLPQMILYAVIRRDWMLSNVLYGCTYLKTADRIMARVIWLTELELGLLCPMCWLDAAIAFVELAYKLVSIITEQAPSTDVKWLTFFHNERQWEAIELVLFWQTDSLHFLLLKAYRATAPHTDFKYQCQDSFFFFFLVLMPEVYIPDALTCPEAEPHTVSVEKLGVR